MYEVNALATRSSTLLEQIANQYNIPGRYKDYRDLLDQSLDAVFILNRDHDRSLWMRLPPTNRSHP